MLVDTHAHLDFPEFATDLDAVLSRAETAEVKRIIAIGTRLASSRQSIELAERYPNLFATVGIHPNSVGEEREDFMHELRALANHEKVVAIGETGLDYHYLPSKNEKEDILRTTLGSTSIGSVEIEIRDEAIKAAQSAAFEQQLELAAELGKNVVIHQRDAWDETVAILRQHPVKAVFHCFNSSVEQALDVIELGHWVSFTGIVTFKNAAEARKAAARIPLERLMVETDCPYLAPVPNRGKRCEPAFVRDTAEAIAELREMTLSELADRTTANAMSFFGLR
ncbi:MAG: TatD family hydrolase [Chthoniobacterales bacterium]